MSPMTNIDARYGYMLSEFRNRQLKMLCENFDEDIKNVCCHIAKSGNTMTEEEASELYKNLHEKYGSNMEIDIALLKTDKVNAEIVFSMLKDHLLNLGSGYDTYTLYSKYFTELVLKSNREDIANSKCLPLLMSNYRFCLDKAIHDFTEDYIYTISADEERLSVPFNQKTLTAMCEYIIGNKDIMDKKWTVGAQKDIAKIFMLTKEIPSLESNKIESGELSEEICTYICNNKFLSDAIRNIAFDCSYIPESLFCQTKYMMKTNYDAAIETLFGGFKKEKSATRAIAMADRYIRMSAIYKNMPVSMQKDFIYHCATKEGGKIGNILSVIATETSSPEVLQLLNDIHFPDKPLMLSNKNLPCDTMNEMLSKNLEIWDNHLFYGRVLSPDTISIINKSIEYRKDDISFENKGKLVKIFESIMDNHCNISANGIMQCYSTLFSANILSAKQIDKICNKIKEVKLGYEEQDATNAFYLTSKAIMMCHFIQNKTPPDIQLTCLRFFDFFSNDMLNKNLTYDIIPLSGMIVSLFNKIAEGTKVCMPEYSAKALRVVEKINAILPEEEREYNAKLVIENFMRKHIDNKSLEDIYETIDNDIDNFNKSVEIINEIHWDNEKGGQIEYNESNEL